jgi:hypothetical protein
MKKVMFLITFASLMLFASQAFALPTLNVGNLLADHDEDLTSSLMPLMQNTSVDFTLLYEMTPHKAKNTFGVYTNLTDGTGQMDIFDQRAANDVATGTTMNVSLGNDFGFYLFNDIDDDNNFDPAGDDDVFLFSQRAFSLPAGNDYQWFRVYDVSGIGYTNYDFNGLQFSGNYDYLLFIDDDHVTGPNKDHNDMIVGVSAVPEPGTLILLGLGLAGAGIIRRRNS